MSIEIAGSHQADEITLLINQAYRKEPSWTRENTLVEGLRITSSSLKKIINSKSHTLLLKKYESELIGCICLEKKKSDATFSLFTVKPEYQEKGHGGKLLLFAEEYAKKELLTNKFIVNILSDQHEIIAFYDRRGYRKTDLSTPFPINSGVGTPLVEQLHIESFEKVA